MKILFITKHTAHDKIAMAGNQLFNYYLKKFCNDSEFEVGYVIVHKNNDDYLKMNKQYQGKAKDFSIYLPKFLRLATYIIYNTFVRNVLSIINPSWYYLDPIYSFFYKKAISDIKKSGWVPDIVVFEWTEMIFLRSHVKSNFKNIITCATEHDLCFIKMERKYESNFILNNLFVNRFKKQELFELNNMDLVSTLSDKDKERLSLNGIADKKIFLLSPYYHDYQFTQSTIKPNIIYYGAMNRVENQEAVDWFLSNVFIPFKFYNQITFNVVGAGVPAVLTSKYSKVLNVNFTGFVEDPLDYFKDALCMVVPLVNGAGIKIKILEGMSASLAVLTNDIGIEGIDAVDKVHYYHCQEPEQYYNTIIKLIENNELAKKVGAEGKKMVNEIYNYENSFSNYKTKLKQLL